MKKLSLILALAGLAAAASAAPAKAAKAPKAGKMATADIKLSEARQDEFYERVEIPTPAGEVAEVSSIALLPGK